MGNRNGWSLAGSFFEQSLRVCHDRVFALHGFGLERALITVAIDASLQQLTLLCVTLIPRAFGCCRGSSLRQSAVASCPPLPRIC